MTKKERHEFYKKLLEVVCEDPSTKFGLCKYIFILNNLLIINHYGIFEKELPELYAQKPIRKHDRPYWFARNNEGWKKRIKCIVKAIELSTRNYESNYI